MFTMQNSNLLLKTYLLKFCKSGIHTTEIQSIVN